MRRWILFFTFLLLPFLAEAEPQMRSFFPRQNLLLGQPLFWIVEIRYPMWESYEIQFGPCADLHMEIADQKLSEVAGELRAFYRIAVIPTALKISCTPALIIADEKGQSIVLSGKAITVSSISGDSEEIKNPSPVKQNTKTVRNSVWLYLALAALIVLSSIFTGRRIYYNTPKQKFLRDIRRALQEVKNKRLPIQVWRLLRSENVWGFPADALTPSQLSGKAGQNTRLLGIASALQSLERWRYSGSQNSYDQQLVLQALGFAFTLAEGNRRSRFS